MYIIMYICILYTWMFICLYNSVLPAIDWVIAVLALTTWRFLQPCTPSATHWLGGVADMDPTLAYSDKVRQLQSCYCHYGEIRRYLISNLRTYVTDKVITGKHLLYVRMYVLWLCGWFSARKATSLLKASAVPLVRALLNWSWEHFKSRSRRRSGSCRKLVSQVSTKITCDSLFTNDCCVITYVQIWIGRSWMVWRRLRIMPYS